jgi:HAMP domain-containing protein
MSEDINFNKIVYDKNQYEKLVNTKFNQIGVPLSPQEQSLEEPTVDEFFQMYNDLFYQIPQKGETNSHLFLIQQSSEYINFNANQAEIEALQNEIGQLRQQLLEEQKRSLEIQTGETICS